MKVGQATSLKSFEILLEACVAVWIAVGEGVLVVGAVETEHDARHVVVVVLRTAVPEQLLFRQAHPVQNLPSIRKRTKQSSNRVVKRGYQ